MMSRRNIAGPIFFPNIEWEVILRALKRHDFKGYVAADIRTVNSKAMDSRYMETREFVERTAAKVGL